MKTGKWLTQGNQVKRNNHMANIHFKNAWHRIRRSPFQALAALSILSVTFFVITFVSIVVTSTTKVLNYFETRPQIIAFLKDEAKEQEITDLTTMLDNSSKVADIKYVTKEDALQIYKKATSDNPLLTELISPSIFPASIEVSLVNLSFAQEVVDEIKENAIVDQVSFTASLEGEKSLYEVIERLKKISYYVRLGGGVFAFILMSTSFLVLLVIISMRITTKRTEIEILKLIGASPGFIRSPIIIESMIYTLIGVFTGWFVALIMVLYATPSVVAYFGDIPILPKDTVDLLLMFGLILLIELLSGLILASLGSMMAVSRAGKKNKKR